MSKYEITMQNGNKLIVDKYGYLIDCKIRIKYEFKCFDNGVEGILRLSKLHRDLKYPMLVYEYVYGLGNIIQYHIVGKTKLIKRIE